MPNQHSRVRYLSAHYCALTRYASSTGVVGASNVQISSYATSTQLDDDVGEDHAAELAVAGFRLHRNDRSRSQIARLS